MSHTSLSFKKIISVTGMEKYSIRSGGISHNEEDTVLAQVSMMMKRTRKAMKNLMTKGQILNVQCRQP